MKLGHFIFLGASGLFLASCSEIEMRAVGPVGTVVPVKHEHDENRSQNPLALGPSRRQRHNAEQGRIVRPGENASCLAAAMGGPCCDFPAWLTEAQKFDGLYAGHGPQDISNAAKPQLFNNPQFNEYGESIALVQMWEHLALAVQTHKQRKYRTYDKRAPWSGVFAHWCLTHAINPKTGTAYKSVAGDPAAAESWLEYGTMCDPCFGALMVVKKDTGCQIAFCVGSAFAPVELSNGAQEYKKVYFGFGGDQGNHVRMSAFAVSDIQAFRLPPGYRPCKEHFKLEHSFWTEHYKQKMGHDSLMLTT